MYFFNFNPSFALCIATFTMIVVCRHRFPSLLLLNRCMAFNSVHGVVVSADARGIVEYWDGQTFEPPSAPAVSFRFKTETDLYDAAKAKTSPCSLVLDPSGSKFALVTRDKHIRIFDFASGKMKRKYDESAQAYQVQVYTLKYADIDAHTHHTQHPRKATRGHCGTGALG